MDIIYLNDLRVEAVIGIWDWERKIRQVIAIDLEMATDIRKAAASGFRFPAGRDAGREDCRHHHR